MTDKIKAPSGFKYSKTKSLIRFKWKEGEWDKGTLLNEDTFTMSYAATALHYGQSAFEGLKAFRWQDDSIHVFRPQENAKRMALSCERLMMPNVPEAMFLDAIKRVVRDNADYVPIASEGALYIRPFIFGCGQTIGISPSSEYEFVVLVIPVGDYYKAGTGGVKSIIWENFDRAAPFGTGHVKAAGNYAADLMPTTKAKANNYDIVLYLDAKTRSYIEEFATSNFVAINAKGTYITPESPTILKSITNKSLMQIAQSLDVKVEKRQVKLQEIDDFVEIGACGTAVVITSIKQIDYAGEMIWSQKTAGAVLDKVKLRYQQIQRGEVKDTFNWMFRV